MPLTPPVLDDRDFETLYRQARARIPNYLPEWTDLNESDPGVALLQLQTWLAETILYRLNRLPELNYLKFLKLIGVAQRPATPATARVTFVLDEKKLPGASDILVPPGTQLRVTSRDLPDPVFFETDESLTAIVARLERLVTTNDPNPFADSPFADVTLDNTLDNRSFAPFGLIKPIASERGLMLGFASEAPMTRRQFSLYIALKDEPLGPLDDEPRADDCGPEDAAAESGVPALRWEWWDGLAWADLEVRDETADLRRSGAVYLRIPGQIPAAPADQVTGEPMSPPITLDSLPHMNDAIKTALEFGDPKITTVAELARQQLNTLCERLKDWLPGADDEAKKIAAAQILNRAKYLATEPLLYWLRVVYDPDTDPPPPDYIAPPQIERILTNTVAVTQAQTVRDEVVGGSDGMPNQVMRLRHAPVIQPADGSAALVLEIDESDGADDDPTARAWRQVDDFAASRLGANRGAATAADREARHYTLDRTTGTIAFGDNRYGKIPRAGQANVIARAYRYGGGRAGNVGAGTIKELVRPILGVSEVFNLLAAQGGEDEESLDETLQRAPREMRANRRAVTLEDFALLARETPGAQVLRAYAYIIRDMNNPGLDACGTRIHVVVVPRSYDPRPSPNETTIRMVCRYLDERRLVTTQVIVQGPTYADVAVRVRARAQPGADRGAIERAIRDALTTYLHPFTGGPERMGWPFGRAVFYSELLREVMAVSGVRRVDSLTMLRLMAYYATQPGAEAHDDPLPGDCATLEVMDVKHLLPGVDPDTPFAALAAFDCCDLPLDEGALVALFHLDIQVDYDR